MDMSLATEQVSLQQMARDFVARHVTPNVREWDRDEAVDPSIIGHLGDAGFLGMTIPEDLGGSGGTHLDYCLVLEELARGDSSVRSIVSVSLGLVTKSIARYGTDRQKAEWVAALAGGRAIGCFGLTEPDTGSDAGNLITRARRDGGDYVVNGSKMFITNGMWADVILLFARTSDDGAKGISAFLSRPRPRGSRGGASRENSGSAASRRRSSLSWTCGFPPRRGWVRRGRAWRSPCRLLRRAACPWRRVVSASRPVLRQPL